MQSFELGWIDREGRWWPATRFSHAHAAAEATKALGLRVSDPEGYVERLGWVRCLHRGVLGYSSPRPLSQAQLNTLEEWRQANPDWANETARWIKLFGDTLEYA